MSLTGKCFCGAVELEVTGAPEAMGYCHCGSCRSWSGGPVNAFSLWKPEAVRITAGAENVAMFQKTKTSQRQYCGKCGGHLMTNHPTFGLVDVFAATIPGLAFAPRVHVNYAETVLPMRDGLPKLKDFPAELGGSGEGGDGARAGKPARARNATRIAAATMPQINLSAIRCLLVPAATTATAPFALPRSRRAADRAAACGTLPPANRPIARPRSRLSGPAPSSDRSSSTFRRTGRNIPG